MINEGNQIHNCMSSSGSGTVINYGSGSGSDFLTSLTSYGSSYGSGSTSQKVTVPTVPVPVPVPQHCLKVIKKSPSNSRNKGVASFFLLVDGRIRIRIRTNKLRIRIRITGAKPVQFVPKRSVPTPLQLSSVELKKRSKCAFLSLMIRVREI
jgi:hypothetical protein